MAIAKVKKGQELVCVLCAREVVVSNWGISRKTLWCCERSMEEKQTVKKNATVKQTVKKQAVKKNATKKK